jgi:hypothetical protein
LATPLIARVIRTKFSVERRAIMFDYATKRESRFRIFWPEVDDLYGAQEAITLGQLACFLTAGITAVFAIVGWVPRLSLVDASIFGLLGFGVLRRWRTAAVIAFLLDALNLVYSFSQGAGVGVLGVFIFVGMLNGVRGTFAYRQLLRTAPAAARETDVSEERAG